MDGITPWRLITARRQRNAPLKPPERDLKPVDHGIAQLRRQATMAQDHKGAAVDHRLNPVRIDARQGDEDQHLAIGLDHVRRRLPGRGLRPAAGGLKELAVQPFGPRQHLAGLRPHPAFRATFRHLSCPTKGPDWINATDKRFASMLPRKALETTPTP